LLERTTCVDEAIKGAGNFPVKFSVAAPNSRGISKGALGIVPTLNNPNLLPTFHPNKK
jgi:hypothetical protein